MTFCPNCGAQAAGSFCPNCGTSLTGASGARPAGAYSSSSSVNVGGQAISDNLAGALCYTPFFIGILCAIGMLLIGRYRSNRLVRFHALQSLFLHLALFVLAVVVNIFVGLFALITHGLGLLLFGLYPVLGPIVYVATLALFLWMMYQTYNNNKLKLPVIGNLAEKQA